MLPTTKENDRLIISRPTIFKRDLKYGDIVTFEAPLEDDLEVNENNIASYTEKQVLIHSSITLWELESLVM